MKETLDIIVWAGFIFLLFIFLRGMNEQQIQKHDTMLKESEEKRKLKEEEKGQKQND